MHVALSLLALVVVQPRLALPIDKGPRPMTVIVSWGKSGHIDLRMETLKLVPGTVKVMREGKEEDFHCNILKDVEVTRHIALKDVTVYRTDGKRVDPHAVPGLLRKEVLALCSIDGAPVDPIHFRLIKEGTLLLVVPREQLFPKSEEDFLPGFARDYH
jgi:hypothetical protein